MGCMGKGGMGKMCGMDGMGNMGCMGKGGMGKMCGMGNMDNMGCKGKGGMGNMANMRNMGMGNMGMMASIDDDEEDTRGGDGWASLAKFGPKLGGTGGCGGKGSAQATQAAVSTCVVSSIHDGISLEEFRENLGQAGIVKSAKFTGGGRALVAFATAEEAKKCLGMFNGCDVGGAQLQVHL